MNRTEFQFLSTIRIAEAGILLQNGMTDGAYYLAGYSVECALKACIAKLTKEFDFPDKKLANDSYTHDLEKLLGLAGLKAQRDATAAMDAEFLVNCQLVLERSEASRYERHDPTSAQNFYQAVVDPDHGVLTWVKRHW